jgi:mannan endo-1,4-beta-mannosidase
LSGATITSVVAYLTKVTIEVTGLEKGKTYTLRIPEGVILGPSKVEAPEISISFTTSSPQQISNKLCTTNPLTQAQNVYDFLIANYGTKIVSGTMASDSWNVNEAEWVFKHTGKYPALNGFDYGHPV